MQPSELSLECDATDAAQQSINGSGYGKRLIINPRRIAYLGQVIIATIAWSPAEPASPIHDTRLIKPYNEGQAEKEDGKECRMIYDNSQLFDAFASTLPRWKFLHYCP